ncbi:MAG: SUMF1/EgtB/PvdO family nonheme iron enzyme, partial [Rubripirellula sp.]|nr:SUMF1/EgtB/PvdO family nonheme iron enzyme [Rubripirellula sp.]
ILLTADGIPKLTDFGLAKADSRDHTMTMAGAVLGTLDFMPPEQRQDTALTDHRSDLWSLAATLYQMVTGESPRVIDLDDVPQELRLALSRALKMKPDVRYQTAPEFRDALLGCLRSPATDVATPFADSPVAEVTVESVAGRCPKCQSQNESSRSFCRGCGKSLRVSCVSCSADIPIWENFCGACGGNQKELIATQSAEEKSRAAAMSAPQITNSIGMKFTLIPSGTFEMGERQTHTVTLTQPFYLGIYAVTDEQYSQVMSRNPSRFKGPQNPVESVSWDDAVEFCRKLSVSPTEKTADRVYRLPTEAEWEYACRAGTTTKYSFGGDESQLGEYAWLEDNSMFPKPGGFWSNLLTPSIKHHHPVGGKKPNPWGLYDMHGNVWEWCSDWYGNYPSGTTTDTTGPAQGSFRVFRGGSWSDAAEFCRSAFRSRSKPSRRLSDLGFRVACVPSGQ